MGNKEDQTLHLARVDNIVNTLACLDVFPSEKDVNDAIVEGLTADYDNSVPISTSPAFPAMISSLFLGIDTTVWRWE